MHSHLINIMTSSMKFVTFFFICIGFATNFISTATNENSVEEAVISIFRNHGHNLCPGTDVCLSNRSELSRTRATDNWSSCCTDCSCEADCGRYNDCCFSGGTSSLTTETEVKEEEEECLNTTLSLHSTSPAFYMVTTCNRTTKCSDLVRYPWGHMLPVYSFNRHKIYVNDMCAICNGATDGKQWDLGVVIDYFQASVLDSLVAYMHPELLKNVYFRYMHDDIYYVSKKRCLASRVENCPSGYLNKSDPIYNPIYIAWLKDVDLDLRIVDSLCTSSFDSTYIYQSVIGRWTYFKNIFCFLCSESYTISVYKQCTNVLFNDKIKIGGFHNFVMILDWANFVTNIRAPFKKACELFPNGTMNYRNCRNMVCPVGQVLGSNRICIYPSREWSATFFEIPVKLSLENPIILPQNTSLEEIRLYTSNIKFSVNALEHNSSIQIKDAYVNVVNKMDSVELDYIALFVVVQIVQLDLAKAVPQLLQFFEVKWTAVYGGSTVTLKQTIMDIDVTSAELVTMMAKEEGRTLPKCSSNLALIYKSLVYESLTKAIPISKIYFCRLIEFVEDEVELLFNDSVVYIKNFNAYFCILEFVKSRKADGATIIKVCIEDLPFRPIESSDARINSISQSKPSFWLCFALILISV